jgi:hypothetical protein
VPELGSHGSVRGARGNSRPYRERRGCVRGTQFDQIVLAADRGFPSGVLSPGRYSLVLGIPVQQLRRGHWRNSEHRKARQRRREDRHAPAHLAARVAQKFEVTSSGALVPATEGSTKPVTVQVTNAGIATVEQYDLRMP